jgi:hypothetical protein
MFRTQSARWAVIASALFVVGCNSCSDRPPLFSRFRTTSTHPVVVPAGDCCNGAVVTGPFVPPVVQPGPGVGPQPAPIPRIDENGKQVPWDPQTSSRPGIKTGNPGQ